MYASVGICYRVVGGRLRARFSGGWSDQSWWVDDRWSRSGGGRRVEVELWLGLGLGLGLVICLRQFIVELLEGVVEIK